jgi:hypothetical protein
MTATLDTNIVLERGDEGLVLAGAICKRDAREYRTDDPRLDTVRAQA